MSQNAGQFEGDLLPETQRVFSSQSSVKSLLEDWGGSKFAGHIKETCWTGNNLSGRWP